MVQIAFPSTTHLYCISQMKILFYAFLLIQNTKRSSSVQLTFNILVYTKLQSRIKRIVIVSYLVERYSCSKYNNSITQIAKQSSFRNDVLDQTVNLLNCDFSVCSISVVQSYNLFSAFASLSTQFLIRHKTFLVTKIRFALDSFNVLYMSRFIPRNDNDSGILVIEVLEL